MLEKNFNNLDNDFITVWSRYITKNEFGEDIYALMALANLGQINAIQSVMLYCDLMECVDKNELNTLVNSIIDMKAENRDLNQDLAVFHYLTKSSSNRGNTSLFKELIQRHAKEKNALIKQRYLEISASYGKHLSKTKVKQTRKDLKEFIQETNKPAHNFAYAKNLYFFGNKKQKELGFYILKDLANRDYSSNLEEEIEITKQHWQKYQAEKYRKEHDDFTELLNEFKHYKNDYIYNPHWV